MVADKADPALGMEMRAVEGDDAGGFLAAMLEGVEPERGQRRGVRVVVDAEDPALLVQPVFGKPAQVGIVDLNLLSHGHLLEKI